VRHRAKPSFTVEVKRNNKRVPLTVAPTGSLPSERHRQADQLLFGDLSGLAEPAGRPKGGRLSTRHAEAEPQVPAAEAVTSETHAEAGRARPTGRILPDLLEQSRAETRLRQELKSRRFASGLSSARARRAPAPRRSGPRCRWVLRLMPVARLSSMRIPMKSAGHSDAKSATRSDPCRPPVPIDVGRVADRRLV
jgi:hypothetical protein